MTHDTEGHALQQVPQITPTPLEQAMDFIGMVKANERMKTTLEGIIGVASQGGPHVAQSVAIMARNGLKGVE